MSPFSTILLILLSSFSLLEDWGCMTLKLAMNYSDQILSTLKSTFGFESLRLQQENIIHSVLSGKDTLGVMPTGGAWCLKLKH